jgi:hypothetical protein
MGEAGSKKEEVDDGIIKRNSEKYSKERRAALVDRDKIVNYKL